ncbi:sensor histidine kinase [Streptomyces sp. NPDC052236]|uniref:sensor histidine kinase n=1 Tax=Streptomyces sp. NPDC052236 TaxID=3365686 RepID=UPI0037CDD35C
MPLRKSLLGRLLAVSALVAACSVGATAWLAVQTTSGAIKQEQGQNLTDDARIYNTLLGYAAANPQWNAVDATVRQLARETGRRIALTTQQGAPIADSATQDSPPPLPPQVSAIVDPFSPDTVLAAGTVGSPESAEDRIDPRAVGPFRLPKAEKASLREIAARGVECLREYGIASDIVDSPSGRPSIQLVGNDPEGIASTTKCVTGELDEPTATEDKALTALNKLANECLDRQDVESVKLSLGLSWRLGARAPGLRDDPGPAEKARQDKEEEADAAADESARLRPTLPPTVAPQPVPSDTPSPAELGDEVDDRAVASCVSTARREQLSSYVAAPALLFIGDPDSATVPGFDLSPANTARIAGAAALILALTVGASMLAATRVVRPLLALTGAAQRMKDGGYSDAASVPVPVRADSEVGRLAAAFNDMSAHRARMEVQRKALVSDVAHELRTPLSNIRGWLEGAQDGIADLDTAFVSSLLEEAVQLQHIIDDLQDLAEADAGALRLHPEPVRIEDLLAQVAAAHQGLAERTGVTLTAAPASAFELPELSADPVRLRQAVGNLVSNAVRHTPSGGSVTLRAYEEVGMVVVDVEDTGEGIAAENLPHVFDRFWRAEKSRSRRMGGSGLGLAIVRKLAEAHGGTVHAVSTKGEGSVFTLRIPIGARTDEDGAASGADAKTTAF